jgi:aryl-alcohol dehydrogenase-like predicted oxidoreductase
MESSYYLVDLLEFRTLGKTEYSTSILTLGGCALGWLHEQELDKAQSMADDAIKEALDQGINMIDVAPSYGEAEVRLTPWIKKYRNKIFLAEKTMERTKTGAWNELNLSLKRLGTSYFDLYQFHAVSTLDELNQIFGKDGAIEAFKEAQETGLIKHIGITCHSDMRVLSKALNMYKGFSTILLPVYVAAMVNQHPTNDFQRLLEIAQEENIGVIAIKAISRRRWTFAKKYETWYQPLDDQKWIDDTVWYTLSQGGVTTYSLPCDLRLWALIMDSVKRFKILKESEQNEIIKRAKKENFKPLFPK